MLLLIVWNSLFTSAPMHTHTFFQLVLLSNFFSSELWAATIKAPHKKYRGRQTRPQCNPHNTEPLNHCLLSWKPAVCKLTAVNKSIPILPTGTYKYQFKVILGCSSLQCKVMDSSEMITLKTCLEPQHQHKSPSEALKQVNWINIPVILFCLGSFLLDWGRHFIRLL